VSCRNRVEQTVVGAVIFGAVLMAAPLGAQGLTGDDGARPVSLREAIELAARNSPAAVSARGLDRNASAARRQALGSYVPNVNLSAGTGRTQGTTINNFNGQLTSLSGNPWSYNNGLALNVELFDGGRRWSEIRRIQSTADVADVSAVSARFDASLQVKQQFYAALAARESAAAAKAQLDAWLARERAADVYVVIAKEERRPEALALVQRLRDAGQRTDFPLTAAKIGKQFQTAEQLGARIAVLVGDEWPQVKVKTLATREEQLIAADAVLACLQPST